MSSACINMLWQHVYAHAAGFYAGGIPLLLVCHAVHNAYLHLLNLCCMSVCVPGGSPIVSQHVQVERASRPCLLSSRLSSASVLSIAAMHKRACLHFDSASGTSAAHQGGAFWHVESCLLGGVWGFDMLPYTYTHNIAALAQASHALSHKLCTHELAYTSAKSFCGLAW